MLEFVRVQKDNRIGRALRVPHFWKLAFTIRLHFWMHVNVWPNVFTVEQQRLTMLVAYSAVWLCDCYRGKVFPGPDLQSVQSYFQKPTSTAARPEIIIVLLSNKRRREGGIPKFILHPRGEAASCPLAMPRGNHSRRMHFIWEWLTLLGGNEFSLDEQ